MMGFGFVVARFGLFLRQLAEARGVLADHPTRFSVWVGSALIVLGVVVNLATAAQHARVLSRIRRGLPLEPGRWSLAILVACLLAGIGIVMTVYLLVEAA
jgi:putative membrane protein